MLLVAPVTKKHRKKTDEHAKGLDRLQLLRSDIPAVTHVDYSARMQTVSKKTNPLFHALISEFYRQTKCPLVINTSFNVRGEPIVCTPQDAYRCFMRTNIDYLVMGNYILDKKKQKPLENDESWIKKYVLD
jgi:carbamoyltransferase